MDPPVAGRKHGLGHECRLKLSGLQTASGQSHNGQQGLRQSAVNGHNGNTPREVPRGFAAM
jgi:hypothetical protein